MQVYKKVHSYIIKKGVNQNIIAEKCNISPSTFSSMMNGKRKMSVEDLRAICYALEVSPEVFINYKEKNKESQVGTYE